MASLNRSKVANSSMRFQFKIPLSRGMERLMELVEAGVNVSLGHDSIMDPWYPLGRGDMLSEASLALHRTTW